MSPEQFAMMLGHLAEIAARSFRRGDTAGGEATLRAALEVLNGPRPLTSYREALAWSAGLLSGDTSPTIDAALLALERAEHPPASLPAQVRKALDDAQIQEMKGIDDGDCFEEGKGQGGGGVAALVLALLGCEAPK